MSLPTIPTINFVITHQSNSFIEEFDTSSEMLDFVLGNIPEVSSSIVREWSTGCERSMIFDEQAFRDYAFDHLEDFLGENGYRLSRVVKG